MSTSDKMTIAVLGTRGFPGVQGGVETHCRQLYMRMKGWHFRVYRRKPYLTEQSQVACDGIEFIDWPSTRIQGFEATWHTLRAAWHCVRHRPALVHVHNMGPALLALPVKLAGVPMVMTYHSVNYEHSKWGPVAKAFLRLSEWAALRWCDQVIFVNRNRLERMSAAVRRKSVYIPNGVNPACPTSDTDFLRSHGIVPGNYVLAVGRITPEKGLEHLIMAAGRSSLIAQVVIAGGCDHGDDYLQHLRDLDKNGKVVFTGYTTGNDLRQLYSHARLMALPSLSEGFPMALLEAMSYGLPIAASDLDATRQVGLPDACYFKPGDTASLQSVVEHQWINSPHNINYDLSPYDWDTIAVHTHQVFCDAINHTAEVAVVKARPAGPKDA